MPIKIVFDSTSFVVINIIEFNINAEWAPGEGLEIADPPTAIGIGDTYNPVDESFIQYVPPVPTDDEVRLAVLHNKLAADTITTREQTEMLRLERAL